MQLEKLTEKIKKLEEDKKVIQNLKQQIDEILLQAIVTRVNYRVLKIDTNNMFNKCFENTNNEIKETLFKIHKLQKEV